MYVCTTLFISFLLSVHSEVNVNSNFFQSNNALVSDCNIPVTKAECQSYANLLEYTFSTSSLSSHKCSSKDGAIFWNDNEHKEVSSGSPVKKGNPQWMSKTECEEYRGSELQIVVSTTRPSGCYKKSGVVYFNQLANSLDCGYDDAKCIQKTIGCGEYSCICARSDVSNELYYYGTKQKQSDLAISKKVVNSVILQDDIITDYIYHESNTQSIDFSKPKSFPSDIFYQKSETSEFGSDYIHVYTSKSTNSAEFRPIDGLRYNTLVDATKACDEDSTFCRGVNEKRANGLSYFTRHKMSSASDGLPSNFGQSENIIRYRNFIPSLNYYTVSVELISADQRSAQLTTASTDCQNNGGCFASGLLDGEMKIY